MIFTQCEIFSPANAQEILFVTGGRVPNVDWFKSVASSRKIFCVDKGIEICHVCEIVPNFLIGDFDSANQSSVDWAREKNSR